jgi:hypothetical protein
MNDIRIDRLALKLTGISEDDGRRLAMLITEGLAAASLSEARPGRAEALQMNLNASATQSLESLSNQIVSELVSQLTRTA